METIALFILGKSLSISGLEMTLILSSNDQTRESRSASSLKSEGRTFPLATATAIQYGSEWSAVSLVVGLYLLGSESISAPRVVVSTKISFTS